MVENSRLESLLAMLEQDPSDEFTRYALALEYKKLGDGEKALEQFDELLERHPGYVPGYFMSGQLLAQAGRRDEARGRLEKGIAAARENGDHHARQEMEEYLEAMG